MSGAILDRSSRPGDLRGMTDAIPRRATGALGNLLRTWRRARGVSQFALATELRMSPRHLSFIETGRSHPSRAMILQLADGLRVPLRERNDLFLAAGYAPAYLETDLNAPELAAVHRAMTAILNQQEPYPAVVLDRRWQLLRPNTAARTFFDFLLEDRPRPARPNLLCAIFDPELIRPYLVDWETVAESLMQRVHREAVGGVPDQDLVERLLSYPGVPAVWRLPRVGVPSLPVIPVSFEKAGERFDYFSTVTTIGTPQDITLQELRIESFFPMNEETAERARRLAGLEA